jgi:hypothetical protein
MQMNAGVAAALGNHRHARPIASDRRWSVLHSAQTVCFQPCGIGEMTHGIDRRFLVVSARLRLIEVIE